MFPDQFVTTRLGFASGPRERCSGHAAVDVDNVGSIRVMEKAGFQREGLLRRWLVHPNTGNTPRDCIILSKTR